MVIFQFVIWWNRWNHPEIPTKISCSRATHTRTPRPLSASPSRPPSGAAKGAARKRCAAAWGLSLKLIGLDMSWLLFLFFFLFFCVLFFLWLFVKFLVCSWCWCWCYCHCWWWRRWRRWLMLLFPQGTSKMARCSRRDDLSPRNVLQLFLFLAKNWRRSRCEKNWPHLGILG